MELRWERFGTDAWPEALRADGVRRILILEHLCFVDAVEAVTPVRRSSAILPALTELIPQVGDPARGALRPAWSPIRGENRVVPLPAMITGVMRWWRLTPTGKDARLLASQPLVSAWRLPVIAIIATALAPTRLWRVDSRRPAEGSSSP